MTRKSRQGYRRNFLALTAGIGLLSGATLLVADDWPQYRGAHRDGIASGDGLVRNLPSSGPKVMWRIQFGPAFSQAAVVGDALYTGTSDDVKEYVVRLKAATAEEVWRTPIADVFEEQFGNGPRATPTVDGDMVFILSSRGQVLALRAQDGGVVWRVDAGAKFDAPQPRFGHSVSPLVVDDLVVVGVGGKEDTSLVALDRKTGAVRWSALSGGFGSSSPIVAEIAGKRQIVFIKGRTATGLDLAGKTLWTWDLPEGAIAMPLALPGDRVFVSASNDSGCAMLRVKPAGDLYEVEVLWNNRDMRNHFNSSVFHDGYIYGFDNATLKCLSAETGELKWAKRGFGKGSLLIAGSRLLLISDKGQFVMADATPDGYRERGTYQALEGKSWTAPSMAGGRLYLRNLTEMTCLDLRG